jgi:L-ascorbate metabolism protein UlaG (beta-lactamase superfamily)
VIRPVLADAALVADVDRAEREQPGALHLWWLGQSGFLLAAAGRRVLLDPYLSDALTRKYAATDRPHVRLSERVVDPALLDRIDVVTSSHAHTDHLDAETLGPVLRRNPEAALVIPEATRALVAERLGIDVDRPLGLDEGRTVGAGGVELHAVAAAHETVERDAAGRCRQLGYVVRLGGFAVFHSGDTVLHDRLADAVRPWSVDVALLPINGRAPERRVAGNLDGPEAAGLAQAVGARLAVPCHYDMFAFNTASPGAFVAACERLGQPFRVLQGGERCTVDRRA